MTDHHLLARYARENSQAAFAELVARHLNLVYSAARRQVRTPQLAEDIAQSVFLDLARHAPSFPSHQPVAAWLHVVTRRTAIDTIRREARRAAREHTAAALAAMDSSPASWQSLEPVLDEAVAALSETDRQAILLRFFENKSLREIGESLGTTDDAAQKRVTRALDQLRTLLARRGLTVTAAGLAADLSAHATLIAPAALGSAITSAVLAGAANLAVPLSATALASKILLFTAAAGLVGFIVYHGNSRAVPPPDLSALAAVAPPPALPEPGAPVLPKAAPARVTPGSTEDLRVALLRQLFTDLPAQNLPELRLLVPADWLEVARAHALESAADIRVALAKLRSVARKKFATHLQTALRRFTEGSGGLLPDDVTQLASHLDAPADAEMLARYTLKRTGRLNEADDELIAEKPTSDIIMSVKLDSWHLRSNSDYAPAAGETETDTLDRAAKSIGNAMGPDGEELLAGVAGQVSAAKAMIEEAMKSMEPVFASFGGEEAFGAELKKAARQFATAHPGEPVNQPRPDPAFSVGRGKNHRPCADEPRPRDLPRRPSRRATARCGAVVPLHGGFTRPHRRLQGDQAPLGRRTPDDVVRFQMGRQKGLSPPSLAIFSPRHSFRFVSSPIVSFNFFTLGAITYEQYPSPGFRRK